MKDRLDNIVVQRQLAASLEQARSMIGAGEVYVNDQVADKVGVQYPSAVPIRIKARCPYVSRGGLKLAKGLTHFAISPQDLICLDIGASSGGFTDCLLQNGAKKVFAIDVAYGQLAWKIRQDPRVVVLERFNARAIQPIHVANNDIQLGVIDVSFISLTKLLAPLVQLFDNSIQILALIKPQFELPRNDIGPGGVVSNPKLHLKAIEKIEDFAQSYGLLSHGTVMSPIKGPKGNTEFLIYLTSP